MESDANIVSSQFAACALVVWLMEYLKLAKWFPLLDVNAKGLHTLISALGAAITASALHFAYDTEKGVFTIVGITAWNIAHLCWAVLVQFAGQTVLHDAIYKNQWNQPKVIKKKRKKK